MAESDTSKDMPGTKDSDRNAAMPAHGTKARVRGGPLKVYTQYLEQQQSEKETEIRDKNGSMDTWDTLALAMPFSARRSSLLMSIPNVPANTSILGEKPSLNVSTCTDL
jgi:hypothetical protein